MPPTPPPPPPSPPRITDDTGGSLKVFSTIKAFEKWWENPFDSNFVHDWAYAATLGSGNFGKLKKFAIKITENDRYPVVHVVVKKLEKTDGFKQNLATFNDNLKTHADIMPSFEYPPEFPESGPLAPTMTFVPAAKPYYICLMGVYTDLYDHYYVHREDKHGIVQCLETLRVACHDKGIGLPDMKLENAGAVITEGRVTRIVLLDIDSILFLDSCFKTDPATLGAFAIIMTYVGLCNGMLVRGKHATEEATGAVKPWVKAQFQYLTSMLFFIFMAQVALNADGCDPDYILAPHDKNGVFKKYDQGSRFNALAKYADKELKKVNEIETPPLTLFLNPALAGTKELLNTLRSTLRDLESKAKTLSGYTESEPNDRNGYAGGVTIVQNSFLAHATE